MAACDSSLQDIAWDIESSSSAWAEDVDTMTYGLRLSEPIDVSGIRRRRLAPDRVVGVRNDGTKSTLGPWDISFSFSCWLTGRGSTSAGAVTLTDLYRLIGHAIGSSAVAASSGTTFSGGTANQPTTAASGTFTAGGVLFGGTLGDGDGDGLAYALSGHSGNTLTLLNNLNGAPVNGAVVLAPDLAYTAASSCTMTGLRFRIETADLQWIVHGCVITGITIAQTNPGENPKLTFQVRGSWAEYKAATFPTASPAGPTAPKITHNASGACFLNTLGTATAALIKLRQFSVNVGLGIAIVEGGLGVNSGQTITGATRTMDSITVSMTVDGEGADTTPTYHDLADANTSQHAMITLQGGDGNACAIRFNNLCWNEPGPRQVSVNGRNCTAFDFMAYNGTTTTTDLTRAAMIIAGA